MPSIYPSVLYLNCPCWVFTLVCPLPFWALRTLYAAMAEQHIDQEFLEYVVKSIVNHSEDVKTDRTVDERGVLLTLHVNPDDMGYVIGRDGQTARALRILLKIVGAKGNARVNMKIYEPENMRREHQEKKGAMMQGESGMHGEAGLVSDQDLKDLGI